MRAILAAMLLLLSLGAAQAQPPADADPKLHDWFQSLTDPFTGAGCCAESDCRVLADADWRATPAGYEIRVEGDWFAVPPERVLQRRPNPTGHAVACWSLFYNNRRQANSILIFCFIRAEEA